MARRGSISKRLGASFDETVREFCSYKASEGVAVGVDVAQAGTSDATPLGSLHGASLVITDTDVSAGSLPILQSFDIVAYGVFRRWCTRRGAEAVAALLEDCCTFMDIRMPASRHKWARAIVASVESECHSSPLLMALVSEEAAETEAPTFLRGMSSSGAGSGVMQGAATPGGTAPVLMGVSHRTTPGITPKSPVSQGGGASLPRLHSRASSASGTSDRQPIHLVWANVRHLVTTTPSNVLLPNNLFDTVYDYVARQMLSQYLPQFVLSPDYRFYLSAMQHMPRAAGSADSPGHFASTASGTFEGAGATGSAGMNSASISTHTLALAHHTNSMASEMGDVLPASVLAALSAVSASGGSMRELGLTPHVGRTPSPAALPPLTALMNNRTRVEAASNMEVNGGMFARLGCVGQGSYGNVTVWRHRLTGVCYAVKSMDKRVLKHKASVHTVVRELACTLAVDSPYVCGFDFSFSDAREIHMGMRMMWRGDLERWLLAQPHKRFDEGTARFYAAQLVVALKHLHQAGVVHRDLKASNVLIDDQGHLRLTDFGLAVLLHSCSQTAPSPERVCRGETSATITHCCLGCLQVTKLKQLQKSAAEFTAKGLPAGVAGMAAAQHVASANRSVVTTHATRGHASSAEGGSGVMDGSGRRPMAAGSLSPSSRGSSVGPSSGMPPRPGMLTPARDTQRSISTSTPVSPTGGMYDKRTAWTTSAHRPAPAGSHGSSIASHAPPVTFSSSRALPSYGFRDSVGGTDAGAIASSAPDRGHAPMLIVPAGHAQAAGGGAMVVEDVTMGVRTDSEQQGPEAVTCTTCGCLGGFTSTANAPGPVPQRQQQQQPLIPAPVRTAPPAHGAMSSTSPTSMPGRESPTGMSDDLTDVQSSSVAHAALEAAAAAELYVVDEHVAAPAPPKPAHMRFTPSTVVHPTVLMDCVCEHAHDDSTGWYKGRAGTSAYWCPQMIGRDTHGERMSYGMDADWWSFGCLVFCLMTGRSPFASGLGTAHDNALTMEGRITWPRGVFSREAKDFISRLLCVDPARRLGSSPHGWRDVMAHPWFARIDWALMEAKVLPAPCVPPYRMATNLTTPPEKIAGQYAAPQHAEAAAAEAEIRTQAAHVELNAEDEAIFRACTYTAPDMLVRALLKCVSSAEHTDTSTPVEVVTRVASAPQAAAIITASDPTAAMHHARHRGPGDGDIVMVDEHMAVSAPDAPPVKLASMSASSFPTRAPANSSAQDVVMEDAAGFARSSVPATGGGVRGGSMDGSLPPIIAPMTLQPQRASSRYHQ